MTYRAFLKITLVSSKDYPRAKLHPHPVVFLVFALFIAVPVEIDSLAHV